jgi:hypothetical protein
MASHRYFKANNPKIGDFKTNYLDLIYRTTNLYEWGISQYLPIEGYKWEVPASSDSSIGVGDVKAKNW